MECKEILTTQLSSHYTIATHFLHNWSSSSTHSLLIFYIVACSWPPTPHETGNGHGGKRVTAVVGARSPSFSPENGLPMVIILYTKCLFCPLLGHQIKVTFHQAKIYDKAIHTKPFPGTCHHGEWYCFSLSTSIALLSMMSIHHVISSQLPCTFLSMKGQQPYGHPPLEKTINTNKVHES